MRWYRFPNITKSTRWRAGNSARQQLLSGPIRSISLAVPITTWPSAAALALMEAEIAINTLVQRLVASLSYLEWRLAPIFRSPQKLPVAWD